MLQSPGTYILLPWKLQKYSAWTINNGTNYKNKNAKGEKEDKAVIIIIIIKNNNDDNKK